MLSVVATRYARALLDVVLAPGANINTNKLLSELRTVQGVIAESETLRNALGSPAVAPSRKIAVMRRLLEPLGLHDKTKNFVYVIVGHRRAAQFAEIVDAFETLLDERLGFVSADIRSAHELTTGQKAGLETQVARLSGRKAKLKFSTDPALIAGVVARVGSTVYDGSVRGQLERLRTRLGAA
jgi:F-type H+-transporting ATPase subunit delta